MHSHLSRPHILVAEDNDTNRKVIMLQLQLLNLSAEAVPNGSEALQCWQSGRFSLLLTDLNMPEMDGFALARAIRAAEGSGQRTPIVAVTASAALDQEARCRSAGIDGCLTKPVRLAELREIVAQWLPQAQQSMTAVTATQPLLPATEVPVDLRVLESLVGTIPATIDGVLQAFLTSAAKARNEIHAAVTSNRAASLAPAAHRLKSAARSIGALQLGEICQAMESLASAADADHSSISAAVQSFATEMTAVQQFIQTRVSVTNLSQHP